LLNTIVVIEGSAQSPVRALSDQQTSRQPTPESGMPNLAKRILSAVVLGPLVLLCVWRGEIWFAALIAIIVVAGGGEWRKMAKLDTLGVGTLLVLGPLFILVAIFAAGVTAGLFGLGLGLLMALGSFGSSWSERRWAVVALLHLVCAALALFFLRQIPEIGRDLVFVLFGAVWLSDIGGYVAGRLFGGAKLAPRISPNKTWAGFAGAISFTVAGAVVLLYLTEANGLGILILAAALSLATQAGDLFESWIKRLFEVKDSGNLIPGHGGVLDRIDGLLFAAPVLALFILIFGTDLVL
jgi:phosphatidate cytidylyltransferase